MFKVILFFLIGGLILTNCQQNTGNPLLTKWDTPFETPPFDKITINHYLPAFEEAIKIHNDEIHSITNLSDDPSFKNTIEALDYSGSLLRRVNRIFEAMNSAMSNDELQQLTKIISPMMSKHKDDVYLNEDLFKRIKIINDNKENLELSTEQNKLT